MVWGGGGVGWGGEGGRDHTYHHIVWDFWGRGSSSDGPARALGLSMPAERKRRCPRSQLVGVDATGEDGADGTDPLACCCCCPGTANAAAGAAAGGASPAAASAAVAHFFVPLGESGTWGPGGGVDGMTCSLCTMQRTHGKSRCTSRKISLAWLTEHVIKPYLHDFQGAGPPAGPSLQALQYQLPHCGWALLRHPVGAGGQVEGAGGATLV